MTTSPPLPTIDEAIAFIVERLRVPVGKPGYGTLSQNGYDVFIDKTVQSYLESVALIPGQRMLPGAHLTPAAQEVGQKFLDAAWELCRRGMFRPSTRYVNAMGADGGRGYSLTGYGEEWVRSGQVPMSRSAMLKVLTEHHDLLGDAFVQRAIEALECFNTGMFLAACAMAGAAAEAVLLKIGEEKLGLAKAGELLDQPNGRQKLIDAVFVGLEKKQTLRTRFVDHLRIVTDWRDHAAHGHPTRIDHEHADTAINKLLRLVKLVGEDWDALTAKVAPP
ncbi:MAG: hypothetical protein IT557_10080 [Alphaproteobacteria bacterium]|nr:hypothetical protein [Alphaproteobacteria bacterium]